MSPPYIEPVLFPETHDFVPTVVYYVNGTLIMLHLNETGGTVASRLEGLPHHKAVKVFKTFRLLAKERDPYDLLELAQQQISLLV